MMRWLPISLMLLGLSSLGCNRGIQPEKPKDGPEKVAVEEKKAVVLKPDFTLTAEAMAKEFLADETAARAKFKDKVVELSGEVSHVNRKAQFFMKGAKRTAKEFDELNVDCRVQPDDASKAPRLSKGQKVKIVGKYNMVRADFIQVSESALTELEPTKILTVTAEHLAGEFEIEASARSKYKDQDVIVSGTIRDVFVVEGVQYIMLSTGRLISVEVAMPADSADFVKDRGKLAAQDIEIRGSFADLQYPRLRLKGGIILDIQKAK